MDEAGIRHKLILHVTRETTKLLLRSSDVTLSCDVLPSKSEWTAKNKMRVLNL